MKPSEKAAEYKARAGKEYEKLPDGNWLVHYRYGDAQINFTETGVQVISATGDVRLNG